MTKHAWRMTKEIQMTNWAGPLPLGREIHGDEGRLQLHRSGSEFVIGDSFVLRHQSFDIRTDPSFMNLPQRQNGKGRIVCLTNVYGQVYHDLRKEPIARCLGQKRPSLYRGLELATDRQIVLLSSPPRGADRRRPLWIA